MYRRSKSVDMQFTFKPNHDILEKVVLGFKNNLR